MFHPVKTNHSWKKGYAPFLFLVGTFALLFSASCSQQQATKPPKSLAKFLDTINYFYDINPPKGLHKLDSVVNITPNIDIESRFQYYFLHYFYHYRKKKDFKKSMLYADSMLTFIEATHDEKKYAKQYGTAYFCKGDVLFQTNRFPEAYQYYYKGELIGRNNFDKCTLGDYSYHMGMIMYKQEHYKLAGQHFAQSFEENKNCTESFPTFYRSQEILDNAAISFAKAGINDSAAVYYEKALTYIDINAPKYPDKAKNIEVARAVIYGNQSKLFILQSDYARGEDLLKKSIEINLKPGNDERDAQLSELKLAHLYADNNETNRLSNLLKAVRSQLDTVKNNEAEVDWNHLMAILHQKRGNLADALNYFNTYDSMKDSLAKANQKLKESDVAQQFREFENQSTINSLKNDNQLQQTYLTIALIYAGMAMVIILLVAVNWRRSKRNVKILSELNQTVTDQKIQLQQSLIELEENNKEKDRILRAVSHDLRNPIGGIASLTALMLMEPDLGADQLELLQLIQTTTNNSLELINEILEATGALSSRSVSRQYVDINILLSHSVELLRFKAAEKNQKIMLDVLDSPEKLFISREKIWRVLSNLISNAIKFSPQDSVINVKLTADSGAIQISVNDHGIGIPDDIKGRVFQMFTDAKRPGTAGEKSFGLGLSISKQIIESHNGEIWFESKPDEGTTFYVRLRKMPA